MSGRRWAWRAAAAGGLWVAVLVVTRWLELDPHPVRLLLALTLAVALLGLVLDCLRDAPATWPSSRHGVGVARDWRGHDQRTAFYRSLIESHLTARTPDSGVRDRLVGLAEQTLRARHGESSTSRADELLGPELTRLAQEPPRRLSRDEIERWIERIERL